VDETGSEIYLHMGFDAGSVETLVSACKVLVYISVNFVVFGSVLLNIIRQIFSNWINGPFGMSKEEGKLAGLKVSLHTMSL
jgi:hypothetical protein